MYKAVIAGYSRSPFTPAKKGELIDVKPNKLLESVNKFKGLNYRQKIIYNKNKLIIINDSKSTSYSSSKELL